MWKVIELWCGAAGATGYLTILGEEIDAIHKPVEWSCSCRECKRVRRSGEVDDQPMSSKEDDRISVVIDIRGG